MELNQPDRPQLHCQEQSLWRKALNWHEFTGTPTRAPTQHSFTKKHLRSMISDMGNASPLWSEFFEGT